MDRLYVCEMRGSRILDGVGRPMLYPAQCRKQLEVILSPNSTGARAVLGVGRTGGREELGGVLAQGWGQSWGATVG